MVAKALGRGHMVVDQRPGIPPGPWATMRPLPFAGPLADLRRAGRRAVAELDLATGSMVNLSLFPNLIFVGNQLLVVEPLAVDRTRLTMYLAVADGAPEESICCGCGSTRTSSASARRTTSTCSSGSSVACASRRCEWIDVSRGLGDGATSSTDGSVVGPITSEAPQRNYVRHYCNLMRLPAPLIAR